MPATVAVVLFVVAVSACRGEGATQPPSDRHLIAAARSGDVGEVLSLLDRGAAVDGRDADGATALVAAAYGNHVEAARLLIGAGADVNVKDNTQQTPT